MKKIILIVVLILFIFVYNNFFTNGILEGKYVNRNYENDFISDIAHVSDTLIITEGNKFESKYYGKGNYKLHHNLGGTNINFNYGEGFTKININGEEIKVSNEQSLNTYINRIWFVGNPKIILFEDLNQYYEKIQ